MHGRQPPAEFNTGAQPGRVRQTPSPQVVPRPFVTVKETALMSETGSELSSDARAILVEAAALFETWHERWQAASGQGYSDTDEALVDVDRVLQGLEEMRSRWRDTDVPDHQTEIYDRCGAAIDDLAQRIEELLTALDARELERLRMLSQAVELSGHQLNEALEGLPV